MPFVLYLLGLAVFAQATSEFMLSGLDPDIAHDLHVSIPAAGWLTTAFAIGMVVGAPAIAVLGDRCPRRPALITTLTIFFVAHVAGALTDSFTVLLITRVAAALANAAFLAVALATATSLVTPTAIGRATSILLGGTTLACIAGVPGGALLGQYYGWRAAFWAVAVISLPALAAIHWSIPAQRSTRSTLRRLHVHRGLVAPLLLGALVNGATFCSFTFLAPILTEVAGFSPGWVPLLLALFGLGSFVGVTAAGRYADRRPTGMLLGAGVALLGGWCAFGLLAGVQGISVGLVLVQGALSFAVGSTLISYALYAVPESPVLAGGLATASLNVGAALGPVLGGVGIGLAGYTAPLWVSAGLIGLALVAGLGLLTALVVAGAPEGSG